MYRVYGPWRYAARRGIADVFLILTCKCAGEGSIRSCEGVYVSVYLLPVNFVDFLEETRPTVLPPQPAQSLPDARAASSGGAQLCPEIRASRLLAKVRGCQDWSLFVVFGAARKYVE